MSNTLKDIGVSEFFIAEYNNIAQAHFNTINTISVFFKHYLVIVSIPTSLVMVALGLLAKIDDATAPFICYGSLPLVLLAAMGLVGLCAMTYIVNLRMDALLYARCVNGIRKFLLTNAVT